MDKSSNYVFQVPLPPHPYGSLCVHFYKVIINMAREYWEKHDDKAFAVALQQEVVRINGLTAKEVEAGIVACSVQDCEKRGLGDVEIPHQARPNAEDRERRDGRWQCARDRAHSQRCIVISRIIGQRVTLPVFVSDSEWAVEQRRRSRWL